MEVTARVREDVYWTMELLLRNCKISKDLDAQNNYCKRPKKEIAFYNTDISATDKKG